MDQMPKMILTLFAGDEGCGRDCQVHRMHKKFLIPMTLFSADEEEECRIRRMSQILWILSGTW